MIKNLTEPKKHPAKKIRILARKTQEKHFNLPKNTSHAHLNTYSKTYVCGGVTSKDIYRSADDTKERGAIKNFSGSQRVYLLGEENPPLFRHRVGWFVSCGIWAKIKYRLFRRVTCVGCLGRVIVVCTALLCRMWSSSVMCHIGVKWVKYEDSGCYLYLDELGCWGLFEIIMLTSYVYVCYVTFV